MKSDPGLNHGSANAPASPTNDQRSGENTRWTPYAKSSTRRKSSTSSRRGSTAAASCGSCRRSQSRSLAKSVRSDRYEIRIDSDFDAVIDGCAAPAAERGQTWINGPIRRLYRALFDRGDVHTVEAWFEGHLVGGLYGVSLGAAFFGESMFHTSRDASKVALVHLAQRVQPLLARHAL